MAPQRRPLRIHQERPDILYGRGEKSRNQEDTLLDRTLDNPIAPRTNKSLTGVRKDQYGFMLYPTQEGSHQILSSMWRSLVRTPNPGRIS